MAFVEENNKKLPLFNGFELYYEHESVMRMSSEMTLEDLYSVFRHEIEYSPRSYEDTNCCKYIIRQRYVTEDINNLNEPIYRIRDIDRAMVYINFETKQFKVRLSSLSECSYQYIVDQLEQILIDFGYTPSIDFGFFDPFFDKVNEMSEYSEYYNNEGENATEGYSSN